jgi:transcriptional regulator with XRE-family HTH domain
MAKNRLALAVRRRRPQPSAMPTAEQIRAARALLGWSVAELSARSGVSVRTITRCELGEGVPQATTRTIQRLVRAFEAGGVEFIAENTMGGVGVRRRRRG